MPTDDDFQDHTEKQEPIFDRWFDLPTEDRPRGGQEESDLSEPRSGFGQDDFCLGV
jgi:hypothetical protein